MNALHNLMLARDNFSYREYVIARYFKYGLDLNPEISMVDGYVTLWSNGDRNILVKSIYLSQRNIFVYDWIDAYSPEKIEEVLNVIDCDKLNEFLSYINMEFNQYKKLIDSSRGRCIIINDLSNYFGRPFEMVMGEVKVAKKLTEILKVIDAILGFRKEKK